MDYVAFCKNYFAITNIPISLMRDREPVYSSVGEMIDIDDAEIRRDYTVFWEFGAIEPNPLFCRISPEIEYGAVHVEDTDWYVIVGPIFSIPVTNTIVSVFMRENRLPDQYREAVAEFLCAIPRQSHWQFARHLALIHQSLNGKTVPVAEIYAQNGEKEEVREKRHVTRITENFENGNLHDTYDFEQRMFQHIKDGDGKKLDAFLQQESGLLVEGKLANTPVRQAKNLFIMTVTKVGMLAAIPGGLDVEHTYQLIDLYIQECERLQTVEAVKSLQYDMIHDFCRRIGEAGLPRDISPEMYQCVNFIRSHANEPLTIDDVAAHISRSGSYVTKHFKEELGIHASAYIMKCKLEEARSLLVYSDRTLADISAYLSFSSQAYFQTVFKKQYGITPMQCRKQGAAKD